MKCEMNLCIYNKNFLCLLKEKQLNALGMCEECMTVSIPDDALQKFKEHQLEEIANRWKDHDCPSRMKPVALGENLE